MNYLSHYYLFQEETPLFTLGVILPDLARSVAPPNIHTIKPDTTLPENLYHISKGIEVHHKTDFIFHSSSYFERNVKKLTKQLRDIDKNGEIKRTSFQAHVLYELCLDYVLLKKNPTLAKTFYAKLAEVSTNELENKMLKGLDFDKIIPRFNRFKEENYLTSYTSIPNILFALGKIFEGITVKNWTVTLEEKVVEILEVYTLELENEIDELFEYVKKNI